MPKRISIEAHLSVEELEERYRSAKEPVERSHYQIIWLLARGRSTKEVAEVTGYKRSWIYELVWGYNRIGPETLGDGRRSNKGAPSMLSDEQQANLEQILSAPAPDGGLWNGRKVADYLSVLLERPVSRQQGWRLLKQLGMSLKVPRPAHEESDPIEQQEWKKKLALEVEKAQKEHPDAEVSVWSQDEHRVGLQPVIRRVWTPRDTPPVAKVNWKREWSWLYAFVEPQTGESYWWILPRVRTDLFSAVLKDFAEHFEIGPKKRVVLALDQAGWHVSDKLDIPEGIHLFFLPAKSPELQPAERLWPLVNEVFANQVFDSIQALEKLVEQRCRNLLNQTDLIRGITFFHWWPEIVPRRT